MNLRITVPYIRCERMTAGLGRDEIYFALMVMAAKRQKKGKATKVVSTMPLAPVYFRVSEVKSGVDAGTQWTPDISDVRLDVGPAEVVSVTLALYECDNGSIRDQMAREMTGPITPVGFAWGELSLPTNPADPICWIGPVLSLARAAFKYFPQDDLLGQDIITVGVNDPNLRGPRDIELRGSGGKYHVIIGLSVSGT